MLYFPREFIYLRFTFKEGNSFYIFDKSYEETDLQKSLRIPRGTIYYSSIDNFIK